MSVLKISITGPESTGKSILAKKLAEHYNTSWVEEYARKYLKEIDRPYMEADLIKIAKGQIENEDEKQSAVGKVLFCDTDLLVIKIWSVHKYKRCHPWLNDEVKKRKYDHYFLMDIDLPWEFDPMRENPHLRNFFFDWYKRELDKMGAPYTVISGEKEERMKKAIEVVDNLLRK